MITRSSLAHLRRPETYRQGLIDVAWSARPASMPAAPPTWELDPARLERAVVRWPTSYQYAPVAARLERVLRDPLRRSVTIVPEDIPQPYEGIVVLGFELDGARHDVVVDYWDYTHVNAEAERRCSLYFKMNHRREGYGSEKVVPGGFFQPREQLVRLLPHLRRLRDRRRFRFDAYGRFSLGFATEVRSEAVRLLSGQRRFGYEGGMKKVRFGEYLREVARAKVCVDLPGNGPFCYRLIDCLAVGTCIVARRHDAVLHVPLVDREHIVYARPDLSDLVELCEHYVTHDAEREAIARAGREFFDRYLARPQLASYYLHTCLQRLA